jgi:hypothetical protein
MQRTRNRPQLVTTIDPVMYKLLIREAERDNRPLSYVVDEALRTWSSFLTWKRENAK